MDLAPHIAKADARLRELEAQLAAYDFKAAGNDQRRYEALSREYRRPGPHPRTVGGGAARPGRIWRTWPNWPPPKPIRPTLPPCARRRRGLMCACPSSNRNCNC